MKGIWRTNPIEGPLFPNTTPFKNHGVTRFYVPILAHNRQTGKWDFNDREVTSNYRNSIVNDFHMEYGLYYMPEWESSLDPQYIGHKMAATQKATNAISSQLDCEYHNCPDLIISIIHYYRLEIPTGPFSWTMEPWQAGWMTDQLVHVCNADPNFVLVVQNFFGDMTPAGKRNGITPRQELINRGFLPNRVKMFYDAKEPLATTWDGCILSEETLAA